jgi:hypothetical protein
VIDLARLRPAIRLTGSVDETMLQRLLDGLEQVPPGPEPVVLELFTMGGDAEIGRRMALEVRLARLRLGDRPFLFLGKTAVQSAGVTMMAAFPRASRFLSRDAVLLVHGRRVDRQISLSGQLRAAEQAVRMVLAEIEAGIALEQEGFRELIEGSTVTLNDLHQRAAAGWYLRAEEVLRLGLVAGLV